MSLYSVFVDGQEGTTGLQIHEYLRRRKDISVLKIDPALRKDPTERARLLNSADVAFLCLPDAAARESVGLIGNPSTCVIDTSTAHRVDPDWTYGLPELAPGQRKSIRHSKRIANPGCHATAFILVMRPLVDAGLVPADWPLSATSHTGYSGGGKQMIAQYQEALGALAQGKSGAGVPEAGAPGAGVSRAGVPGAAAASSLALLAPRPYALGLKHKHLPEMQRYAALQNAPLFSPVVGPFYKGLAVSIPLDLVALRAYASSGQGRVAGEVTGAGDAESSRAAIHAALSARYAQEPFVQVAPLDAGVPAFFDVQGSNDTNRADLFVFGNDDQCLLVARIDNLGKGASGAAVQAMNIHLGVEETLGLV